MSTVTVSFPITFDIEYQLTKWHYELAVEALRRIETAVGTDNDIAEVKAAILEVSELLKERTDGPVIQSCSIPQLMEE